MLTRKEKIKETPTSWPLGDYPVFEHGDGGRRRVADRPDVRPIEQPELELDQILIGHLLSDKSPITYIKEATKE